MAGGDGAADQDHQLLRETFRIRQPGRLSPQQQFAGDVLSVLRGRAVNRIVGRGEFGRGVHEEAAAKIGSREPRNQEIEESEDLGARIAAAAAAHVRDRIDDVLPITVVQHGEDQVVLALEMLVERRLGDADFAENPLQAHRLESGCIEQVPGRLDEAIPRAAHNGFSGADRTSQVYQKCILTCTRSQPSSTAAVMYTPDERRAAGGSQLQGQRYKEKNS
jgi:hypothetical protein